MTLSLMFLLASQAFDLPPEMLRSVCYVESTHSQKAYNPHDGNSPSHGVCQIKLESARQVGFKGTADQLQEPAANTFWAAAYLHHQFKRYHGDIIMTIAAYNAGSYRSGPDGLPLNKRYVRKVLAAWKAGK